jgi:microcystin-dependent protein
MNPFLGEIQLVAGTQMYPNFVACNGEQLNVAQNSMLFSLIGTLYGGDGLTNFRVPNLAHRAAVGQGAGPGLTPRVAGQAFGADYVQLTTDTMPEHNHYMTVWSGRGEANRVDNPNNGFRMANSQKSTNYVPAAQAGETFAQNPGAILTAGADEPHENRQAFLAMTFAICLNGEFPTWPDP